MKKVKRVLSVILAVVMLVTTLQCLFVCFAEEVEDEAVVVDDIVQFGYYPQTLVTDEDLIQRLNNRTLSFTSYEYFSGNGEIGSMAPSDYMEYCDLFYEGKEYRAVRFSKYRPYQTFESNDVEDFVNDYQKKNGYEPNTIYWFEYKPIQWRVLDPENGLLISEYILDAQAFSNYIYNKGGIQSAWQAILVPRDSLEIHYCHEWEYCSLRKWLNSNFIKDAFSRDEKYALLLDEQGDRVSLATRQDVYNQDYGKLSNTARITYTTDYAQISGADAAIQSGPSIGKYRASWLLKDPGDRSYWVYYVTINGQTPPQMLWYDTNKTCGVRPMIQTKAFTPYHEYTGEITDEPECMLEGVMTYTCSICGKTYTEAIPALGHAAPDENGDCPRCGLQVSTQETPTDPTNPSDPADPTDPTTPSDPADPTDPTTPNDPVNPTDPTNPSDPADPTDPTNPTQPTAPQQSSNSERTNFLLKLIQMLLDFFYKVINMLFVR